MNTIRIYIGFTFPSKLWAVASRVGSP